VTAATAGGEITAGRARVARNAVMAVFAVNGFAFASVVSRLPAIRGALHLDPGGLGLVLLAMSSGAVLALPSSGPIVHRLGPGRAVLAGASLMSVGLVLAALAPEALGASVPAIVVGFFAVGVGTGVWDVSMNVEGADVERHLGRPIMPRFHAAFSLGTVAGALVGSAAAWAHLGVAVHVLPLVVLVYATVVVSVRVFLPSHAGGARSAGPGTSADADADADAGSSADRRRSGTALAWRERRTLLIGLMVLGMAFAEGSANDWLAVGYVDGFRASQALAAAGYGVFVAAMTLGRLTGPAVLQRLGRVLTVRGGAVLVLGGVLVFVLGAAVSEGAASAGAVSGGAVSGGSRVAGLAVGTVGAVLWGLGASLGFPIGMSAAADDPARSAARVSVVASIGYVAFLAGPPLLGTLGTHVGVVHALLAVAGAVALAFAVAGAARPLVVPTDEAAPGISTPGTATAGIAADSPKEAS